jgi:hypothetical protein
LHPCEDATSAGLPDGICIFRPKFPIWVHSGGSWNGKCWYTYLTAIWSVSSTFGIFWSFWGIFPRFGILATLHHGAEIAVDGFRELRSHKMKGLDLPGYTRKEKNHSGQMCEKKKVSDFFFLQKNFYFD